LFKHGLNLNVFDGLFFGGMYYIIIPLFYFVFINPSVEVPPNIYINSFQPLGRDLTTSVYIFISVLLFSFFSLKNAVPSKSLQVEKYNSTIEKKLYVVALTLYLISEFIFLFKSGKLNGDSHWYSSNVKVFQEGVIYTFLGQFNNVGRLILPAICMYFQLRYKNKEFLRLHIFTSLLLIPIELIIAGNRIAILYIGFSHIIPILYNRKFKQLFVMLSLILPLYFVAVAWPVVRGLIWTDKLSFDHIEYVVETAFSDNGAVVQNNSFSDPVMVLTEGTNLFVLNDIFIKYPQKYDFIIGETMIVRPLGVFFPKKIWKDKPETLGLIIGKRAVPDTDEIAINTSIIGESWANFGWLGNIIVIVLISGLQYIPRLGISKKLMNCILFFTSLAVWRFDFTFFVISVITLYIYLYIARTKIFVTFFTSVTKISIFRKLRPVRTAS
jgi:hypothetical protein